MAYTTTGTTTGMDVFETAITLMDELNDAGKYKHEDTEEYRQRTKAILNILIGELYVFLSLEDRDFANGEDTAYLCAFRVKEGFRGQGLGSHLMNAALSELKGILPAKIRRTEGTAAARASRRKRGHCGHLRRDQSV